MQATEWKDLSRGAKSILEWLDDPFTGKQNEITITLGEGPAFSNSSGYYARQVMNIPVEQPLFSEIRYFLENGVNKGSVVGDVLSEKSFTVRSSPLLKTDGPGFSSPPTKWGDLTMIAQSILEQALSFDGNERRDLRVTLGERATMVGDGSSPRAITQAPVDRRTFEEIRGYLKASDDDTTDEYRLSIDETNETSFRVIHIENSPSLKI